MTVLAPILMVVLVFGFIAYVLKRDSDIDKGKDPLVVKVPGTSVTLTPSRWFWRKVRENKRASAGVVVVVVFWLWFWLK